MSKSTNPNVVPKSVVWTVLAIAFFLILLEWVKIASGSGKIQAARTPTPSQTITCNRLATSIAEDIWSVRQRNNFNRVSMEQYIAVYYPLNKERFKSTARDIGQARVRIWTISEINNIMVLDEPTHSAIMSIEQNIDDWYLGVNCV